MRFSIKNNLTRRQIITGGFSFFALASAPLYFSNKETKAPHSLLLSAAKDKQGLHYLIAITEQGQLYFKIPIAERAHDSIYNPLTQQAIFFGRSPSRHIYIVDIQGQPVLSVIKAPRQRHFYGHGVFDKEYRYLYTVENDVQKGLGLIGVYDSSADYKRIGEFSTGGIGPHQTILLSDNRTLVVANGGLLKSLPQSKSALSQNAFDSSLAYIDTQTGRVIDRYKTAFKQLSLRHISCNERDDVFIGAQSYRETDTPLLFSQKYGRNLEPFIAEDTVWKSHNRYTASLVVKGDTLTLSSPRGNMISFWDVNEYRYLSSLYSPDAAGLAITPTHHPGSSQALSSQALYATNGSGAFMQLNTFTGAVIKRYNNEGLAWDNHLSFAYL
ncbi:MAG: DUF1513 domain-containing protein [Cellvibrionaceae bacterium]